MYIDNEMDLDCIFANIYGILTLKNNKIIKMCKKAYICLILCK